MKIHMHVKLPLLGKSAQTHINRYTGRNKGLTATSGIPVLQAVIMQHSD
jgi:hypothetical protein